MYTVYGLKDPRDGLVFYVGITDDMYARFLSHLKCDGSNLLKDARITEIKNANRMVIMEALQDVEGLERAKKREAYWIRHFYDLGISLTNLVMPMCHDNVVIVHAPPPIVDESIPRLRARMPLDEQKEYILHCLNLGISRNRILKRVDGYIHHEVVQSVINASLVKPVDTPKSDMLEVPERWRTRILAKVEKGIGHKKIQQQLGLSGDQYWMIQAVADEYKRSRA